MPWRPFLVALSPSSTALQCPGGTQPQTGVPSFQNQLWSVLTGRVSRRSPGYSQVCWGTQKATLRGPQSKRTPTPSKTFWLLWDMILHRQAGQARDEDRKRLRLLCTALAYGNVPTAVRAQPRWGCKGQEGQVSSPPE